MKLNGSTQPDILKYPLEKKNDILALIYIFDNIEIIPYLDGLYEFMDYIGKLGVVCAFHSAGASPYHHILRTMCRIDTFYYLLYDYPEEMRLLSKAIQRVFQSSFEICIKSKADVIMSGLNVDTNITPPNFFDKYILSYLRSRSKKAKENKKIIAIHTDGENRGLLDSYIKSEINVADSICPKPMTSLSFQEIYNKLKNKIVITGGIPSNILLRSVCSEYEFNKIVDNILEISGTGLLLSIADTTPPDADVSRLLHIQKKANEVIIKT